jgi:hypothetical protein
MKEYSEIVNILLNSDTCSIARGLLSSLDCVNDDETEHVQLLENKLSNVSRAWTDEIFAKSSSIRSSSNIVIQGKLKALFYKKCTDIDRIDTVHHNKSSSACCPLSLEGIRQVAQSGFLNTKEMGRVFLLTSPKITRQIGNEFIWDSLCSSILPDLALIPGLSTYSHEWIFREFSKPVSVPSSRRHQFPPISPSTFPAESVVMYLQWFAARSDPKPVATIELPIDCLHDLLDKGKATISSCYIPEIFFDINTIHKLHTRVVCLRKDRRQCCTLHEAGEYTWEIVDDDDDDDDESNHSTGTSSSELKIETGNIYFGPKNKLTLDESGRNIEKRLTVPDRDANGFELLVAAKATRHISNRDCDAYSSWRVCELTLQFWANFNQMVYIFNSQEEVQNNGVTMLHILDQLLGWNG